ncbi:MAG: hypothetical protein Q7T55_13275 [Solirubrobacteraceae bacterium]|nr:hypothetical protein [Solirubrobacteraceae bacterium]
MPIARPRSVFLAALAAALTCWAAPPAGAAGVVLDTFGDDPSIGVDASGTGHLAWYTQTGAQFPYNHVLVYCRLPRGAETCARRTNLPTPGNLDTFNQTQVVVDDTSGKLYLLASLAGDNVTKGGTWAWTSTNGGESFGAPVRISNGLNLSDAVLGPGPFAISTVGEIPSRYHADALDGSTATAEAINLSAGLKPGTDYFYSTVGMLNSTTPFVVLNSGAGDTVMRRFDPAAQSGANVVGNWLPAQQLATAEGDPRAASGPSGSFVATDSTPSYPTPADALLVRRIGEDGTIGAPQDIIAGTGNDAEDLDLAQDAGGRVHAVYNDIDHGIRLTYQWSKRGETWGTPQVIDDPGAGYSYNELGVGPDGGGWVVNEKKSSANGAFGPIHVVALDAKGSSDPPAPTPAPGAPPTPVPTATPLACPLAIAVSPSADAVVRSGPCFTDLGKGVYRSAGTVRLAGIDFVPPKGGGTLTVDTKAHTVETTGGDYETRAGAVVLSRGKILWDLDQITKIEDLGKFGVSLLGLKLAGTADLSFKDKSASIHVWMELPSPLDKVRADTTVRTTMNDGLRLDDVHLTAKSIPIGPLFVNDFDLLFSGGTNRFVGEASVTLPPAAPGKEASIKGAFALEDGKLTKLAIDVGTGVPPLPLPLFPTPPILLTQVGIGLTNDEEGFRLGGGVVLSLGPQLAGSSALSIRALPSEGHGAYVFVPKSGKYAQIGASGTLSLVDLELAYGSVSVRTDGPITFSGGTTLDLGLADIAFTGGGGINLGNGDFYGTMKGSLSAGSKDFVAASASASAIISSIGFAACGTASGTLFGVDIIDAEIGFEKPWGGDSDVGFCNLDAYKPASLSGSGARARRLQAGGPQTITLGEGTHGLLVRGASAAPGFTLTGPGGRTLTVSPGGTGPAAAPRILALPTGTGAVAVKIDDAAGSWTITPAATGAAITDVQVAGERPEPKAKATVAKGAWAKRKARVQVSDLGDQTLTVRELLPDGSAHELGTVRKSGTTTLSFTPAHAAGGRRTLEAVVAVGTRQVEVIGLGSYVAPSPQKLTAPRKVTLKRTKTQVSASWTKVAGAAGYRVSVKGDDGRLQLLPVAGKTTKLVIPGVTTDDRIDVSVVAVDRLGAAGPKRAATSKGKPVPKVKTGATKTKPKKKTTAKKK